MSLPGPSAAAPLVVEPALLVATDAHEGPVYVAEEDALYFTTRRPDVALRRLALDGDRFGLEADRVTTVRASTASANGMALDADGRLIICEQGSMSAPAAILRVDRRTGRIEVLADGWGGLPLNSPNDVTVASDGGIWFTDPSYGHAQGFRPPPVAGDHVYRRDPTSGEVTLAADGFDKPNGLAFSPREDVLYVGDNGAPHHLVAFDVAEDGRLAGRRVVAEGDAGHPDGLAVDAAGRVYLSALDGVRILAPDGGEIARVVLPGAVNFTFGGPPGHLLITADDGIWAARLFFADRPSRP